MIVPRNTIVVVTLIDKAERKIGQLTVPTANEQYTEAEVVAVGPGTVQAEGGRSETFDLYPGQRVWVKHKLKRDPRIGLELATLPYQDGDVTYHLVEQSSIVGIIAQPVDRAVPVSELPLPDSHETAMRAILGLTSAQA